MKYRLLSLAMVIAYFVLLGQGVIADIRSDLRTAVQKGDTARVKALLDAGGDFQTFDKNGRSPLNDALDVAAKTNRSDITELLREHIRARVVGGFRVIRADVTTDAQILLREIESGGNIVISQQPTAPPEGHVFVIVYVAVPASMFSPYEGGKSERTKDMTQTLTLRDGAKNVVEPLFPAPTMTRAWVPIGQSFGFRGQLLSPLKVALLFTVRRDALAGSELWMFAKSVGLVPTVNP